MAVQSNNHVPRPAVKPFIQIVAAHPTSGYPNQSLPITLTEAIRALNAIHGRPGGARSPALREWYLSQAAAPILTTIFDAMRRDIGSIRLDDATEPFAAALRDMAQRYDTAIVAPRRLIGLHEPRAIDVPFVRQDYLLESGAVRTLHDVYGRFPGRCQTDPGRRTPDVFGTA